MIMESLRELGLAGQDVQGEQENVVNYEIYLPPDGTQLLLQSPRRCNACTPGTCAIAGSCAQCATHQSEIQQ